MSSLQAWRIRTGTRSDLPILTSMLYEAFSWSPDLPHQPVDVVLARDDIGRYVRCWGRPGDAAVIAVRDPGNVPTGAAWYRLFPLDDHGYGYVDARTPELSIGVDSAYRGIGVGRALLQALLIRARHEGVAALSLSVEPANMVAVHLYEQCGFRSVGTSGGSLTMVVNLDSGSEVSR